MAWWICRTTPIGFTELQTPFIFGTVRSENWRPKTPQSPAPRTIPAALRLSYDNWMIGPTVGTSPLHQQRPPARPFYRRRSKANLGESGRRFDIGKGRKPLRWQWGRKMANTSPTSLVSAVGTAWPATRPAHSFLKFHAYPLNVLSSGFRFLDGDNPAYPLIAREWRNILPLCQRRRVRNENCS
jgi:hypothetical protein